MLYLQLTPCFYWRQRHLLMGAPCHPCPPALRCPRDQGSLRSWASSQATPLLDPHLRMHVSCCAWESPSPEAWAGRCSVAANFCDAFACVSVAGSKEDPGQPANQLPGCLPLSIPDARLFAYDEKLIAPDMRPRTYSEQALKFVSQLTQMPAGLRWASLLLLVASCNKKLP